MSYKQAMRHFRNHRKDRFTQQCSGPVHDTDTLSPSNQEKANEIVSLMHIAERTEQYPIYIKPVSGGVYATVSERDSFATKIESIEKLHSFIRDFTE